VEGEVEHQQQLSMHGLQVVEAEKETDCLAEDLGFLSRLL
jgi:hypothetical protein